MTTVRRWRKSSRSQNTSTCVEVSHTLDAIRDSKRRDGPVLPARALPELIRHIQAGHLDR